MRYQVKIHEDSYCILIATYPTKEEAVAEAMKSTDDALPNNTAHVYEDGKDIGYAYEGGDGGTYWKDTISSEN